MPRATQHWPPLIPDPSRAAAGLLTYKSDARLQQTRKLPSLSMFRAGVVLSLTALALGLSSGDLHVSLKAISSSVQSVDDIILTAVVSNPTKEDIRVIAKNNVLDRSATRSFALSKDDSSVLFTGVRVSIRPVAVFSWMSSDLRRSRRWISQRTASTSPSPPARPSR